MEHGVSGIALLAILTVSYWIVGGAAWIRRQRAALRNALVAAVAEDSINDRALVEIKGHIDLVELAAYAVLPPLALGALWLAFV